MNPLTKSALAASVAALTLSFTLSAAAQTPGANDTSRSSSQVAATNQGGTASTGTQANEVATNDRRFMVKAAQGSMAEIQMGKVAQEKAQRPEVKQFAERMVADHGKASDELKSIAERKNVELPGALDRSHKSHADKLARLQGAEFDRQYMKHMVDDHKKTVADFEKASKSAKDDAVKSFAAKNLPTLREHYAMARSTYDVVKGGKSAGKDRAKTADASGGVAGAARK